MALFDPQNHLDPLSFVIPTETWSFAYQQLPVGLVYHNDLLVQWKRVPYDYYDDGYEFCVFSGRTHVVFFCNFFFFFFFLLIFFSFVTR